MNSLPICLRKVIITHMLLLFDGSNSRLQGISGAGAINQTPLTPRTLPLGAQTGCRVCIDYVFCLSLPLYKDAIL